MTGKPLDQWASTDVLAGVVDVEIAAAVLSQHRPSPNPCPALPRPPSPANPPNGPSTAQPVTQPPNPFHPWQTPLHQGCAEGASPDQLFGSVYGCVERNCRSDFEETSLSRT